MLNKYCLWFIIRPLAQEENFKCSQRLLLAPISLRWTRYGSFLFKSSLNTHTCSHTQTGLSFTLAREHRPIRHSRGYCGISTPGGWSRLRRATSVLGADILLRTQSVCGLQGTDTHRHTHSHTQCLVRWHSLCGGSERKRYGVIHTYSNALIVWIVNSILVFCSNQIDKSE